MNPGVKLMLDWKAGVRARVQPILDRTESAREIKEAPHRSIFHELRDSNLPPEEKTIDRLCDEGQILTGAGTETTAATLSQITFYLLSDKEVLNNLRAELQTVMPTPQYPISVTKLEQLPYLVCMLQVVSTGIMLII